MSGQSNQGMNYGQQQTYQPYGNSQYGSGAGGKSAGSGTGYDPTGVTSAGYGGARSGFGIPASTMPYSPSTYSGFGPQAPNQQSLYPQTQTAQNTQGLNSNQVGMGQYVDPNGSVSFTGNSVPLSGPTAAFLGMGSNQQQGINPYTGLPYATSMAK